MRRTSLFHRGASPKGNRTSRGDPTHGTTRAAIGTGYLSRRLRRLSRPEWGWHPTAHCGFTQPETFPHFSRCDETTPEYTKDWTAVIRDGGPARGFSQIMPAFGSVLAAKEIDKVVAYLRSLCKETGWPEGELNVPRALVTEKAFPESETILTTTVNTKGPATVGNELGYERTLGKRDQLEVAVPFGWAHQTGKGLAGGIGDLTVGDKHVVFSQLNSAADRPLYDSTGSILSIQGEITLPTGSVAKGLGTGETTFGAFAAYDILLPAQTFLQTQAGVELPVPTHNTPRSGAVEPDARNTGRPGSAAGGGNRLGRGAGAPGHTQSPTARSSSGRLSHTDQ